MKDKLNAGLGSIRSSHFIRDYGMIFVLLLLCAVFSLLTIKSQNPTGAAAGKQVAKKIVSENRSADRGANVIIVTRDIPDDLEFSDAVKLHLEESGANVIGVVNGDPSDARKAIENLMADGFPIDAIAAVDATAKWPIYDRFETVGSDKCVTPNAYIWPNFLKVSNLLSVANQTAIIAIIAIGMTMVIVTGGIDLSVGSLMALAAVTAALIVHEGTLILEKAFGESTAANLSVLLVILGCSAAVLICSLSGTFVGLVVTFFRLPAFIVTLAIMWMAKGLAFRLSDGQSISELPNAFFWIGKGQTLGIPNPVLLMIGLYIVAHLVMTRTVFGRYVYAIGGNEEAARLSGVPVKRVLIVVYLICGALAGLGGVMQASELGSGDPKYGVSYELSVIAAVVVGGTSLMGGRGKIFGTLIGAFIIAVIRNGMNLMNIGSFDQEIVLGAILLLAVLLDTLRRRGS